jgi:hypothetical protein
LKIYYMTANSTYTNYIYKFNLQSDT